MRVTIRRRELLVALGGAAAAWPLAAHAQQPAIPVIGYLSSLTASATPPVTAFRVGLSEAGFEEGKNVRVEYRFAEGQYDRLPALAADLVHYPVAVVIGAAPPAALAAKAATKVIPVVFVSGDDPIKSGLVEKLNRPGGNVTGISVFSGSQLGTKQVDLLHHLIPTATAVALLVNPANSVQAEAQIGLVESAARALGLRLHVVNASRESDFDKAFTTVVEKGCNALVAGADPFFFARREQLIAVAARYAIPAIYEFREYAVAGGLMSYGPSLREGYRQAGIYAARIIKGERPGDLPVILPTKFELVINLKTAKALGITVPDTMQLLADEVIE